MEQIPTKSIDLINELDKLFPDKMVIDDITDFDRIKLAGKVELIRYLNNLLKIEEQLNDK